MNDRRLFFGLLQRRECVVPTWRGLFAGIAVAALAAVFVIRNVYSFLAVTEPSSGGALVIEGWGGCMLKGSGKLSGGYQSGNSCGWLRQGIPATPTFNF
jgi:hypothetical protein